MLDLIAFLSNVVDQIKFVPVVNESRIKLVGECFFCHIKSKLEPCHYDGKDVAVCSSCADREEVAFDYRLNKYPPFEIGAGTGTGFLRVFDLEGLNSSDLWHPIFVRYEDCLYSSGYHCGGEGYEECLQVLDDAISWRANKEAGKENFLINKAYINYTFKNCCTRCKIKVHLENEYWRLKYGISLHKYF